MTLALTVNGAPERHQVATVAELLREKGVEDARKGIAVALNGAVVPRRAWGDTPLAAGDQVEIIEAKQGLIPAPGRGASPENKREQP